MTWRVVETIGRVLSLLMTFAAVGAGIGLWLGEITARSWPRDAQTYFVRGASDLGAAAAVILGPLIYLFLGRRISFWEFSGIITATAIVGGLASLPGWEIAVPVATVFAAIGAAILVKALREPVDVAVTPARGSQD